MMGHRAKLINGNEWDALTKARHRYCYTGRAGVVKWVKQKYNRRQRRLGRLKLRGPNGFDPSLGNV